MSVAIKKIEGVESVDVSLNEGNARITFRAENRVRWETIVEAVKNKGFTPKEARVTALADLKTSEGHGQVIVTVTKEIFQTAEQVTPADRVLIQGVIAAPNDKKRPPMITITKAVQERKS